MIHDAFSGLFCQLFIDFFPQTFLWLCFHDLLHIKRLVFQAVDVIHSSAHLGGFRLFCFSHMFHQFSTLHHFVPDSSLTCPFSKERKELGTECVGQCHKIRHYSSQGPVIAFLWVHFQTVVCKWLHTLTWMQSVCFQNHLSTPWFWKEIKVLNSIVWPKNTNKFSIPIVEPTNSCTVLIITTTGACLPRRKLQRLSPQTAFNLYSNLRPWTHGRTGVGIQEHFRNPENQITNDKKCRILYHKKMEVRVEYLEYLWTAYAIFGSSLQFICTMYVKT